MSIMILLCVAIWSYEVKAEECPTKNLASNIYFQQPLSEMYCMYSGMIEVGTENDLFKYFMLLNKDNIEDDVIIWLGSIPGDSSINYIFSGWLFNVSYDGKIYKITQNRKKLYELGGKSIVFVDLPSVGYSSPNQQDGLGYLFLHESLAAFFIKFVDEFDFLKGKFTFHAEYKMSLIALIAAKNIILNHASPAYNKIKSVYIGNPIFDEQNNLQLNTGLLLSAGIISNLQYTNLEYLNSLCISGQGCSNLIELFKEYTKIIDPIDIRNISLDSTKLTAFFNDRNIATKVFNIYILYTWKQTSAELNREVDKLTYHGGEDDIEVFVRNNIPLFIYTGQYNVIGSMYTTSRLNFLSELYNENDLIPDSTYLKNTIVLDAGGYYRKMGSIFLFEFVGNGISPFLESTQDFIDITELFDHNSSVCPTGIDCSYGKPICDFIEECSSCSFMHCTCYPNWYGEECDTTLEAIKFGDHYYFEPEDTKCMYTEITGGGNLNLDFKENSTHYFQIYCNIGEKVPSKYSYDLYSKTNRISVSFNEETNLTCCFMNPDTQNGYMIERIWFEQIEVLSPVIFYFTFITALLIMIAIIAGVYWIWAKLRSLPEPERIDKLKKPKVKRNYSD